MDIDIAKVISYGLRQKGMTQTELAEHLEVSRQQVSKWVSGLTMPRSDKMIDIIMILGIEGELFPTIKRDDFEKMGLVTMDKEQMESLNKRMDELEKKQELMTEDVVEKIKDYSRDELKMITDVISTFGKDTLVQAATILSIVKNNLKT